MERRGAALARRTRTRSIATACAIVDLLNPALLRTHIKNACDEKNTIAHALFGTEPLDPKGMYEEYSRMAEQVAPFVTDTAVLLNEELDRGGKT